MTNSDANWTLIGCLPSVRVHLFFALTLIVLSVHAPNAFSEVYDPFENPTQGLGDTDMSSLELEDEEFTRKANEMYKKLLAEGMVAFEGEDEIVFDPEQVKEGLEFEFRERYGREPPEYLIKQMDEITEGLQRAMETGFRTMFAEGALDGLDVSEFLIPEKLTFASRAVGKHGSWHTDRETIILIITLDVEDGAYIGTEFPAIFDKTIGGGVSINGVIPSRQAKVKNTLLLFTGTGDYGYPIPEFGAPPVTHRTPLDVPPELIGKKRFVMLSTYEINSTHKDYKRLVAARYAKFMLEPAEATALSRRLLDPKDPKYIKHTELALVLERSNLEEGYKKLDQATKDNLEIRFNPEGKFDDIFDSISKPRFSSC